MLRPAIGWHASIPHGPVDALRDAHHAGCRRKNGSEAAPITRPGLTQRAQVLGTPTHKSRDERNTVVAIGAGKVQRMAMHLRIARLICSKPA